MTDRTQAYVNWGRWVADCPRPLCGNAVQLTPKQTSFFCEAGCLLIAEVEWPNNVAELDEVLQARPVPAMRNWAPAGHRQAIVTGFPEGQTPSDLVEETAQYQGVS